MKLFVSILAALGLQLMVVPAQIALADSGRTPADATAHALNELANCRAQQRPECPTATSTPTATPTPPASPSATPTAVPESPSATPTPLPELSVSSDPLAGYVRPTSRDATGSWLELAIPQGRWAVLYDTTLCAAPSPWTNVELVLDEASVRPITVDTTSGEMCAFAAWSWASGAPCAIDDQGHCDVTMDGAYWDAVAQQQETAAAEDQPTVEPTATPTPAPRAVQAVAAPPPSAAPQAQVVLQTVVVVVTAVPADTAPPTPAAASTYTPRSTYMPVAPTVPALVIGVEMTVATVSPTSSPAATSTPVPVVAAAAEQREGVWSWSLFFQMFAVVVLAVAAIGWLATRRRVAVWTSRKQPGEDAHA